MDTEPVGIRMNGSMVAHYDVDNSEVHYGGGGGVLLSADMKWSYFQTSLWNMNSSHS